MKCPRCGSKRLVKVSLDTHEWRCWDCLKEITNEELYKTRLDKVLSKFEDGVFIMNDTDIELHYTMLEEFKICSNGTSDTVTISLDTVESLLKDLEELK